MSAGWIPTDFGCDLPGDQQFPDAGDGPRWGWIGKEHDHNGVPQGGWHAYIYDTDSGLPGAIVEEYVPHPSEAVAKHYVEMWVAGGPCCAHHRSSSEELS